MKKYIFLFLWGISVCHSKAQGQDTSQWPTRIQISLLTCDASWDIYTLWGHTAIRVVDSAQGTDIVFNYGTFNFNEPNFIAQFVKGDLLYFVSVNNYSDFLNEYQIEKRNVYEQVLNLNNTEKIKWYTALQLNMLGSNRFYLYNFISNNCTTRIKDGLFKNTAFQPSSLPVTSYRASIVSAPYNHQLPWIGLGIDLLLGAYSDQKPSDFQAGFLPFLFHQQVANTKGLVVKENVFKFSDASPASNNTPLSTLLVILILYAFCSRFNSLITQKIAKIVDVLLLISLGVGGSLMFYMSFISKHTACYQNYNLMWIHPFYLIALIFYFIPNKIIGHMGLLFLASTVALILTSYWLPQHFSLEVATMGAIALLLNYRLVQKGRLQALFVKQ